MPAPSVRISTSPESVAFTVPVRFMLLAVRVIRPPLDQICPRGSDKSIPSWLALAVSPVISIVPAPPAVMIEPVRLTPVLSVLPVPREEPVMARAPFSVVMLEPAMTTSTFEVTFEVSVLVVKFVVVVVVETTIAKGEL